jgi:hypothetical protein
VIATIMSMSTGTITMEMSMMEMSMMEMSMMRK